MAQLRALQRRIDAVQHAPLDFRLPTGPGAAFPRAARSPDVVKRTRGGAMVSERFTTRPPVEVPTLDEIAAHLERARDLPRKVRVHGGAR
jgi:hypothetical protein